MTENMMNEKNQEIEIQPDLESLKNDQVTERELSQQTEKNHEVTFINDDCGSMVTMRETFTFSGESLMGNYKLTETNEDSSSKKVIIEMLFNSGPYYNQISTEFDNSNCQHQENNYFQIIDGLDDECDEYGIFNTLM